MTDKIEYQIGRCIVPGATDGNGPNDQHQPRGSIVINAPPEDGRCNICETHVSKLDEFGGAGDPLVGDFKGMKLVKTWREDFTSVQLHG